MADPTAAELKKQAGIEQEQIESGTPTAAQLKAQAEKETTTQGHGTPEDHPAYYGFTPGHLLSQAGQGLSEIGGGLKQAVLHPVDTLEQNALAAAKEHEKAGELWNQPGIASKTQAAGHAIAGSIPFIGPWAAGLGEQAGTGDIGGAIARGGTQIAAGEVAPRIVKGVARGVPKLATELKYANLPEFIRAEIAPPTPLGRGITRAVNAGARLAERATIPAVAAPAVGGAVGSVVGSPWLGAGVGEAAAMMTKEPFKPLADISGLRSWGRSDLMSPAAAEQFAKYPEAILEQEGFTGKPMKVAVSARQYGSGEMDYRTWLKEKGMPSPEEAGGGIPQPPSSGGAAVAPPIVDKPMSPSGMSVIKGGKPSAADYAASDRMMDKVDAEVARTQNIHEVRPPITQKIVEEQAGKSLGVPEAEMKISTRPDKATLQRAGGSEENIAKLIKLDKFELAQLAMSAGEDMGQMNIGRGKADVAAGTHLPRHEIFDRLLKNHTVDDLGKMVDEGKHLPPKTSQATPDTHDFSLNAYMKATGSDIHEALKAAAQAKDAGHEVVS